MMLYYIIRLADNRSMASAFKPIETFLDVSMNENGVQITGVGGLTNDTMSTSYLETKATVHAIINFGFTGLFLIFLLAFVNFFY